MRCWLCTHNTEQLAMSMTQFIQDHVGTMDLDILAAEVHNELSGQIDTDGIDVRTVKEHITTHTLNPTVRLGVTLRNLLDLSEQVRGDLRKVDATGQSMGLDPKMIDAYIRLQGQILNVYKSETNRMMFGTQHT
jgi:hypothetical protein